MLRGRYRKIENVDRRRIVDAFIEGRDWREVAQTLGIKRQSARNVVVNFQRNGLVVKKQQGGRHYNKIDEAMLNFIIKLIENKPTVTLQEMCGHLSSQMPQKPRITPQALSKRLDGKMITLKDLRIVSQQWNTPQRKQERKIFAEWLVSEGLNQLKIFVDEFGINLWTSRTKGRSPKGERSVSIVEGQRGRNITICLAVSDTLGLVHSRILEGGMTKDRFSDFLSEMVELLEFQEDHFVILCDNAPAHVDAPNVGNFGYIKYLPKYSPFLNACEMAGSSLKAAIKRRLTEPSVQQEIYDRDSPRVETLHARRVNVLRREVELALDVITPRKCIQWVNHTMSYLPMCLREADIFD